MTVEDVGNLFLMVLVKVDGDGLVVVMVTRYIKIKNKNYFGKIRKGWKLWFNYGKC